MHPYWAVRRLTQQQLCHEKDNWKPEAGRPRPRFNCEMKLMSLSSVCIACISERALNRTRLLEVPFLLNNVPLQAKEELLLEVGHKEQKAQEKRKRTWKEFLQEQTKKSEKIQKKQSKAEAKVEDAFLKI